MGKGKIKSGNVEGERVEMGRSRPIARIFKRGVLFWGGRGGGGVVA